MMYLNKDFYSLELLRLIDPSIQSLLSTYPPENNSVKYYEYMLFHFIREDFVVNIYSLNGWDIDLDSIGFSSIRRNTRHMVEAYFDLINLSFDSNYIEVLKCCSQPQRPYDGEYIKYLNDDSPGFTILVKYRIAKERNQQGGLSKYYKIAERSNCYVHPNVFVRTFPLDKGDEKAHKLKELLKANLEIMMSSYYIILIQFSDGVQPTLMCQGCNYFPPKPCGNCIKMVYNRMKNLIENGLISYSNT